MKSVTRRQFVRQSCLSAASAPLLGGLILPHTLRAAPASEKIRVGLIGCGGMGKGDLLTFLLNSEV